MKIRRLRTREPTLLSAIIDVGMSRYAASPASYVAMWNSAVAVGHGLQGMADS